MCSPAGHGRPLSVLIVDGHPDGADTLALVLAAAGHRVAIARTGPEALAAAARDRPDVVLTELRLPGLDGWEVARRLKAGGRPVRVVAVTTCGQPADRERSWAAGIDFHLVKPADPLLMLAVLSVLAMSAPAPA